MDKNDLIGEWRSKCTKQLILIEETALEYQCSFIQLIDEGGSENRKVLFQKSLDVLTFAPNSVQFVNSSMIVIDGCLFVKVD